MDKLEILWTPQGTNLPSLGARSLTDISDGDTPNIRMPIRMLSIDTPETTARSDNGAAKIDAQFQQLADWIQTGQAPVSDSFAHYILPKLADIDAGTLQFRQGKQAGEHYQQLIDQRLTKPSGSKRKLFVRSPEPPFDGYGRLLAYVSPSYSTREIATLSRTQRATFNLNMVESGWAAPFILFPNIPGELDLPLFVEQALAAKNASRGQYQQPLSMPGYEYRMCEKLYSITKKLVNGERLSEARRHSWRSRYCADMRDRRLYGPTEYMQIPEPYRLWIWPVDLQLSISRLNLIPLSGG
ncbi:nuclease [Motiliproteus coralliicola]|uniref:Nuclease n=1 Tax=Motiliproteus coralliicola TaxID=2283196 RepID=A0A369WE69_9GAMM|nr:nuclease [Motiliproteus coralliicola]RDE19439.1 nuclease [Motiliproteus coralliicola]